MTIQNEKYEVMDIDDVFIIQDIEEPNQMQVTCFYVNEKDKDVEWDFVIKLN